MGRTGPREYLAEAGGVVDGGRADPEEAPGRELEKVVTFLRGFEDQGQGEVLDDPAGFDATLQGLQDRMRTHGADEPVFREIRDLIAWTRDELENRTRLDRYA